MNAWYVDPTQICTRSELSCTHNPDGSYDIRLVMEFKPQRWFYIGVLASGAAILLGAVYFYGEKWHGRRRAKRLNLKSTPPAQKRSNDA